MPRQWTEALTPPLLMQGLRVAKRRLFGPHPDPDRLFDGDDQIFKAALQTARVYGEYGCGASTLWVARTLKLPIVAVDTSADWLQHVRAQTAGNPKVTLFHADCGDIGDWGRPETYDHRTGFHDYTDWLWRQALRPDVVLIDGRFRVCCFLTSLKHADAGTRLIFDDYTDRRWYHIVERLVPRHQVCGRQCLFVVPPKSALDMAALDRMIDQFRLVMD